MAQTRRGESAICRQGKASVARTCLVGPRLFALARFLSRPDFFSERGASVDSQGSLEIPLSVPLEVTSVGKVPDIIPITDLRQDAAGALKRVKSSRQAVVITQRGRAAAVLLSMETYERSEHERQLLHLLARGEQEIAAGRGFELDDVLAEADALVAGRPK